MCNNKIEALPSGSFKLTEQRGCKIKIVLRKKRETYNFYQKMCNIILNQQAYFCRAKDQS